MKIATLLIFAFITFAVSSQLRFLEINLTAANATLNDTRNATTNQTLNDTGFSSNLTSGAQNYTNTNYTLPIGTVNNTGTLTNLAGTGGAVRFLEFNFTAANATWNETGMSSNLTNQRGNFTNETLTNATNITFPMSNMTDNNMTENTGEMRFLAINFTAANATWNETDLRSNLTSNLTTQRGDFANETLTNATNITFPLSNMTENNMTETTGEMRFLQTNLTAGNVTGITSNLTTGATRGPVNTTVTTSNLTSTSTNTTIAPASNLTSGAATSNLTSEAPASNLTSGAAASNLTSEAPASNLTSAAPMTNATTGASNMTNATTPIAGAVPGTNTNISNFTLANNTNPVPISSYMTQKKSNLTLLQFHRNQLDFITDQNGFSLYIFENDLARFTACLDACTSVWPPALIQNANSTFAGKGTNQTFIGSLKRPNGDFQATYNGWPLYYYSLDKKAGDINGHGIFGFGGVWWLLNPNGRPATSRLYNTTLNNPSAGTFVNNANIPALPTQ